MKHSAFWASLSLICCALLLGLAVQQSQIESKLDQLTRPSRLFTPRLIESTLPLMPDWEVYHSPDRDRFLYILAQQRLQWMGKGQQSVVFATPDGRYVIKFVQIANSRSKPHGLLRKVLGTRSFNGKWFTQLEDGILSAKICCEMLPEETGVLYAHLNRTKNTVRGMVVLDHFGQQHRILADNTCFLVQKRAIPLIPELTQRIRHNDLEMARRRIDQLITLLVSLARKGYIDGEDDLISSNAIGFTSDRAIYIDTWHFFRAPHINLVQRMQYEFGLRLVPLERWLKVSCPELAQYYRQQRNELMARLSRAETAPPMKTG